MLKKLKLYLDTSVPNAYFDEKNSQRQITTKEFWQKLGNYDTYISDLVKEEITATLDEKLRQNLLRLISSFTCLSSKTEEIDDLAKEYLSRKIIPVKYIADAVHIAVATVNGIDILVSWNFEHIVKLRTKREVNATNILLGYTQIEIIEAAML